MKKDKLLFQHLAGDNIGSITTLNYIDDTSSDEALFVFDDGFKCFESFVLRLNETNNEKKVIAHIESKDKKWIINKTTPKIEKKKGFIQDENNNQIEVDIPNPYLVDKNGNINKKALQTSITFTPPAKSSIESDFSQYYSSNDLDIELDEETELQDLAKEESLKSAMIATSNTLESLSASIMASSNKDIFLDANKIADVYSSINIITKSGKTVEIKIDEFLDRVARMFEKADISQNIESLDSKQTSSANNFVIDEIYSKCLKQIASLDLSIDLDVPSIEMVSSIKNNYPEEWTSAFISKIVDSIDMDDLKLRIATSLEKLYDIAKDVEEEKE